ncbi:SDR family oxidoreductase [Nocardia sp. IFM 10818]
MTSKTAVVHGAGGTQGAAIANRLRAAGWEVRALGSATVDLTDLDSVLAAYTGADAVVVQLPLEFTPTAVTYAETILAALAKSPVPQAILNPGSPLPPEPIGRPYVDARVLLARGLPAAVDRAAVMAPAGPYLENLVQPWSVRRVRSTGELAYPFPADLPIAWSTLDDLGDLIAAALAGRHPNPLSLVTGPEPLTGHDIAAAVATATGRDVRWTPVTPPAYGELLVPVIGAAAAAAIAAMYEQQATTPPPALPAELLHRGPTTVTEWARRQGWA